MCMLCLAPGWKGSYLESSSFGSDLIRVGHGNSLVAQWLRLLASKIGDVGLFPGWGTKIPHVVKHSQRILKNFKRSRPVTSLLFSTV